MSNFAICVVHLGIGAILGDPKFGAIHLGSPHCIALAAYTWLTLVINCNNEVCSPSNNAVRMAFWQKKVLPKQRISCCEGIYSLVMHISGCNHDMSVFRCHSKRMVEYNSLSIGYYGYLGQVSICSVKCRLPTKLQESNVFRDACLSAVGKGVMVPLYVMAAPQTG